MKKILTILMVIMLAGAAVFAADVSGPTKIVLNYKVLGSDVSFKMVDASSTGLDSVTSIEFGDISGLNHNLTVLSDQSFKFIYNYNIPSSVEQGQTFSTGTYRLGIACQGLQLNGSGKYLISAEFVKASDTNTAVAWPSLTIALGDSAFDKTYGEAFRVKLANISGSSIKAGSYTGVVSISLTNY
ncbi:MAG: hypothetical protein PHO44_07505 [Sphaerochaetaceae bacterium]|jgi:hypothetical protein|nr:hypothetical protein [Sphaerochaetaceae bacterium]MDD4007812.1 hypothetical protein [Sphaerochaetaceae bacterium]MDD4396544.1 hypothetical protein [Sphaerochaetaceae bacterium]